MGITNNVEITFNGQAVGFVLVEWIGLYDASKHMQSDLGLRKELNVIDSSYIIHEFIEKGLDDFKDITQLKFEIKDGFFNSEVLDNSGNVVKMFMVPLSYIHTIQTDRKEPSEKERIPMHKLSKEQKSKER